MTGREKLLQRMEANAESFCEAYPTSAALLQTAMMEAMPWVLAMKTQGQAPNKLQLERLATQILAILMASLPPDPEPAMPTAPVDPLPEGAAIPAGWPQKQSARVHTFK